MSQMNWTWGASWHDREQNQAIEGLSNTLAVTAARQRRQVRDAQRANQRVAKDLTSLSARVDDFIEYTDLRFELQKFSETASARHRIERRFQTLAGGDVTDIGKAEDVIGYWLPPAAHAALVHLADSGTKPLADELEQARSRDRIRTELFLLATGTGFERVDLSRTAAEAVLGLPMSLHDDDEEAEPAGYLGATAVAVAWRQLWRRAALGEFGEAVSDVLRERLAGPAAGIDAQRWLTALRAQSSDAPANLATLLQRCETALSAPAIAVPGGEHIEVWRGYLQELVEEGFGPERPLMERIRQIRDAETDTSPRWRRPAGTAAELLIHDVLGVDAEPAMRNLALGLCAHSLLEAVDQLRIDAHKPAAPSRTVRTVGVSVTVTQQGIDPGDQQKIDESLAQRYPRPSRRRWKLLIGSAAAAAGVAVVCLIAALTVPAVLAFVAAAIIAIVAFGHRSEVRQLRERHAEAVARMETDIRKGRDAVVIAIQSSERDRELTETTHDRLVTLLNTHVREIA